MQAGRLNRRVVLQAPGTVTDAWGQPIPGWTDVATVSCEPMYQSGIETIRAGADTSITKVSMRMRKRSGVTNAMRLVDKHDGTVYEIENVVPDNRDRGLMFAVCKVVA